MKIVVAMDSFKESLSAAEACDVVAGALALERPEARVVVKPMAEGGAGTAEALMRGCGGLWVPVRVMGPLEGMRVEAGFAWFESDRSAVVEMAAASGLGLVEAWRRDPLAATTFGTGELIGAAMEHGAERVYLAVGGSATVDGGTGAAAALGWRFLDGAGAAIGLGGGGLVELRRIVRPGRGLSVPVEVLCDVDNPLCGARGAARVYGPQKGATAEMVERLEAGLENLAGVVKEDLGEDIAEMPGGGAAGGLAAGAAAFFGARLVSGIEFVMGRTGLMEEIAGADWVITGEGRFDEQSLCGKVISGVVEAARDAGARVGVIAGQVVLDRQVYSERGVAAALSCMREDMSLEYAMANARALVGAAAREFTMRYLQAV